MRVQVFAETPVYSIRWGKCYFRGRKRGAHIMAKHHLSASQDKLIRCDGPKSRWRGRADCKGPGWCKPDVLDVKRKTGSRVGKHAPTALALGVCHVVPTPLHAEASPPVACLRAREVRKRDVHVRRTHSALVAHL